VTDAAEMPIRLSRRELSRLLTRIENGTAGAQLAALYPQTGQAHVIGITGSPGAGKSSLVTMLALHYRKQEKTVAIVAVDPTSPFTGGAILGDRIRMRELSGDPGVFIRSMATRGALGGIAATTIDMVRAFDAAGYDYVIIETVGAGQSEVEVARAAHTTLVLEAPGMGDDVQAIKAGILETADILVINKADRPGLENTVRALRSMLDLGHRAERIAHHGQMMLVPAVAETLPDELHAWQTPLLQTVATTGQGIPELAEQIAAHYDYLQSSGTFAHRERARLEYEIAERLRTALLARLLAGVDHKTLTSLLDRMVAREIDPGFAVHSLMSLMGELPVHNRTQ
jgi:LAO/AO transport system kinase